MYQQKELRPSATEECVQALSVLSLLQCITNGVEQPPKLPFPWGDLGPHQKHGFLGPLEHTTQTASRSGQASLYSWPHAFSPYTLKWVETSPPKTAPGPLPNQTTTYLDRFIHFCRAHPCVQQTDRPKHRPCMLH